MNGLAISVLWAAGAVAATASVLHLLAPARRLNAACVVFAIGLIGLIALRPQPAAEAVLAVYFYTFWFFGVFAQMYLLADRGFSLAMLTDVPADGRTREEIKRGYAGGAGVAHVQAKRLPQLARMGWVRQKPQGYRLTPLGRFIGRLCVGLHRLYRFHEVG